MGWQVSNRGDTDRNQGQGVFGLCLASTDIEPKLDSALAGVFCVLLSMLLTAPEGLTDTFFHTNYFIK